MKRRVRNGGRALGLASVLALLWGAPLAQADDITIGVIASFSGPYGSFGTNEQQAVELAMAGIGGHVGDHAIKLIYRDVGGSNPPRAKQLAEELVVRDKVQYLAGLEFTPTVLALADVINEAKIPFVMFNAGTSDVTRKSQFYVRPGFTEWEVAVPSAQWAADHGKKTAVIIAADYAPGKDAFDAFHYGFESKGGKIVEEIRVPLGTADFSPYLQKIRDLKPDCTLMFMPGGPMSIGFIKAYDDSGLRQSVELFGGGETSEKDLPAMGVGTVGITTAANYSPDLQNPTNQAFVAAYKAKYGKDTVPDGITVSAYDAMKVIFHMIEATNGQRDGVKAIEAAKGFSWNSPRGPVTIDPKTRDIIQPIYIRQVTNADGVLVNREVFVYPAVKDPWKELHPE